jgi:RNA polymerase sigma-70 factor (ECF subfamily)
VVDRARSFDPVGRASVLDPSEPGAGGRSVDPLHSVATAQASARLQAALEQLPLDQRSAVVLFYLEGMTLDEIASIEDVAVGTIKSRLHRARVAMAALLDPGWNELSLWN